MAETCKWCRGTGHVPSSKADPSRCPVCERKWKAGTPTGMTHILCTDPRFVWEHFDHLDAEIARLRAENEALVAALRTLSRYREEAHSHDDDMGHPRRYFADTEEWDRVEELAQQAIEEATRG